MYNLTVLACGRIDADGKAVRAMAIEGDAGAEVGAPYVYTIGAISLSRLGRAVTELVGVVEDDPLRSIASPKAVLEAKDEIMSELEDSGSDYVDLANRMAEFAEAGASLIFS
jgi:hypothetical protein